MLKNVLRNIEVPASKVTTIKEPLVLKGKSIIKLIPEYRSYKNTDFLLTGELKVSGRSEKTNLISMTFWDN